MIKKVADNVTESGLCVDCGANTAPGIPDGPTKRREIALRGKSEFTVGPRDEVYMVHAKVWKKAGMKPWGGCLCIGCLEDRLGRKLTHMDFDPNSPLNQFPRGTERLFDRKRNHAWKPPTKFSWNDET